MHLSECECECERECERECVSEWRTSDRVVGE